MKDTDYDDERWDRLAERALEHPQAGQCGACGEVLYAGLEHECWLDDTPEATGQYHRATCPGPGACDWPEAHDGFPG